MSDAEMQRDDAWAFGRPLVAGDFTLGIYQPSPETLGYWQGVSRRELMVRWCVHCPRS